MKFQSRKSGIFNAQFIIALLFPFAAAWFAYDVMRDAPWMIGIVFIPTFVLIWIYTSTSYEIAEGKLLYRSAFIRGAIDISAITRIDASTTAWIGKKAATGTGGIVITYDDNKTIYITPVTNESMIKELRKINRNIAVGK